MKRKKPPTLRSEIASLRRAMLHQVKATRRLCDAQQINTRKLNALMERAK